MLDKLTIKALTRLSASTLRRLDLNTTSIALIVTALLLPLSAQAQTAPTDRNAAILHLLGISTSEHRGILTTDHGERPGYQNLFLLLRLKARPEIVDDRRFTHEFMSLFSESEMARFRKVVNQRGPWRGDDEFQQDDTRKQFLAAYKSRILQMIPELPLAMVLETRISTKTYNQAIGGFDLSEQFGSAYGSNNLWRDSNSGAGGLQGAYHPRLADIFVAAPARFPNLLRANEEDARRIREFERSNKDSGAVLRAAVKFAITNVRPLGERRFVADTMLLGFELRMGAPLGASVSLSEPTYAVRSIYAGSAASQPAILNADLTRILAAKVAPQLISDDVFIRNSFSIRALTERQMMNRGLGSPDTSNWPPGLPSGFVAFPEQQVGPSDLAGYREWMKSRSSELSDVVRIPGIRTTNGSIQIAKIFDQWRIGSVLAISDKTRAAIRQKYPNVIGLAQAPSWDDMGVVLAMSESEHWLSEKTGLGESADVFVDFKILTNEVILADGKPVLILLLDPVALGRNTSKGPLVQAMTASKATSEYQYDVLGVKLGMDVDEVKEKILSTFGDYQTGVKVNTNKDDPVFPEWIQIDVGRDNVLHERFLFASLAGSRKMAFLKRAFGPGMPSTDGIEISKLINQKYGPAKKLNHSSWGRSPNPATMSRLEAAKGCYSGVGFPYDPDNTNYAFIKERCGEVLAIHISDGRASYMLYDTTAITNARYKAAQSPKAPDVVKGSAKRL